MKPSVDAAIGMHLGSPPENIIVTQPERASVSTLTLLVGAL